MIRFRTVATIVAMIAAGAMALPSNAADEPVATTFVSVKFEGVCDAQNNRLWLLSTHTFKTIAVTLRWRAARRIEYWSNNSSLRPTPSARSAAPPKLKSKKSRSRISSR